LLNHQIHKVTSSELLYKSTIPNHRF